MKKIGVLLLTILIGPAEAATSIVGPNLLQPQIGPSYSLMYYSPGSSPIIPGCAGTGWNFTLACNSQYIGTIQ